jgi:hypothetical protein
VRSVGINGFGGKCRSLSQEDLRSQGDRLCCARTGILRHARAMSQAGAVRDTNDVRTSSEDVLQAADFLPQANGLCSACSCELRPRTGLLFLRRPC